MEETIKAEKQWYIATTYSSHEDKVADNIRKKYLKLIKMELQK